LAPEKVVPAKVSTWHRHVHTGVGGAVGGVLCVPIAHLR
jgi:hypothetical protein